MECMPHAGRYIKEQFDIGISVLVPKKIAIVKGGVQT
jgi:hypothetical protein